MAKEKNAQKAEETKSQQAQVANEENIMDTIRQKNVMSDDAVKQAVEQIAKDETEDKKREAMRAIKRFEYKNSRALIELRKRRAEDKATKAYLTKTKEILDGYLGGKMTRVEADKADTEADKAKREEFRKIDEEFSTNVCELRDAYPGYYCYEWDTWR